MSPAGIRPARPGDEALICDLILELARYERLEHEARAAPEALHAALFAPTPRAACDIGVLDGVEVGFALWFYNFSTFEGRAGIHLEDLFVRPAARGRGIGRALIAGLARRCFEEDLGRLEWSVLDWNAPSIAFYDGLGAESRPEWVLRRLSGSALLRLAAEA